MSLRKLLGLGKRKPKTNKMVSKGDASAEVNDAANGLAKMTVNGSEDYEFGCAPGVLKTRVGFTGGKKASPTYYSLGDHTETVEIRYDPSKTSYGQMLDMFWANHDSTACHSRQYMSAIFYHNKEQERLANETKEQHQKKLAKNIVTRIVPANAFYDAEDYHQKYLLRQNREILRALKLSDKELITSMAATRLNGYCGGFGKLAELEKEIESFKLDQSTQEELRQIVARGSRY